MKTGRFSILLTVSFLFPMAILIGETPRQETETKPSVATADQKETTPGAEPEKADPVETDPVWIDLFNGKDLSGWTPKIRFAELGDNWNNTFRVEDGVIKVSYEDYPNRDFGARPNERFGHLFYKTNYSDYVLRMEYRFTGKQALNGPGWAIRNSGVMVHGQDPATMAKNQDFPVSIEVQLLGGNGKQDRTTGNLCTPGTNVFLKNELYLGHCFSAVSETYHGEQWVECEIEVRGSEVIRHRINGQTVLEYTKPQLDERDANSVKLIAGQKGEKLLSGGTISLQSESHPCEFRNIRLRVLKPLKPAKSK